METVVRHHTRLAGSIQGGVELVEAKKLKGAYCKCIFFEKSLYLKILSFYIPLISMFIFMHLGGLCVFVWDCIYV